jgi:hypothetical protein
VYRIDPATMTVVAEIDVPTIGAMTSTTTAVWIASPRGPTIARIDPTTNRVDKTVSVDRTSPTRFLVATPTRLWAAIGHLGREQLVVLSARTGRRLGRVPLRDTPTALTVSDQVVWGITNTISPRHRIVAADARNAARLLVHLVDDVRATSLAVADDSLFAADGFAGQLVQLRFSR